MVAPDGTATAGGRATLKRRWRQSQPAAEEPEPLDRDEEVKLDLPFEKALRALLETQLEPETATPDDKRKQ